MELNFNAEVYEPTDDFSPIPAGRYTVQVVRIEEKKLKDDKGSGLNLTYEIISENNKGRLVWEFLNVNYKNPADETKAQKVRDIANNTLYDICQAAGLPYVRTEDDLRDLVFDIDIKVIPADKSWNGKPGNEIAKYYKKGDTPASSPEFTDDPLNL